MPPEIRTHINSLIIVCCHAIWLGGASRGEDEAEWLIEPFQVGETPTFISHIKRGLEELSLDETRILVFSGGATKRSKTILSEATSYRDLALANDLFGYSTSLKSRISTDDSATDSFQNVLFPLVLFSFHATGYQKTKRQDDSQANEWQKLPKHLTIVGHEFKRKRFEELHLPAVRWPRDPLRFRYVGIDPPMDSEKRPQVLHGEMLRGYGAWEKDMYGTRDVLASKRLARGWSSHKHKELEAAVGRVWQHSPLKDNMRALLSWDGGANGQDIYPDRLPWDPLDS